MADWPGALLPGSAAIVWRISAGRLVCDPCLLRYNAPGQSATSQMTRVRTRKIADYCGITANHTDHDQVRPMLGLPPPPQIQAGLKTKKAPQGAFFVWGACTKVLPALTRIGMGILHHLHRLEGCPDHVLGLGLDLRVFLQLHLAHWHRLGLVMMCPSSCGSPCPEHSAHRIRRRSFRELPRKQMHIATAASHFDRFSEGPQRSRFASL